MSKRARFLHHASNATGPAALLAGLALAWFVLCAATAKAQESEPADAWAPLVQALADQGHDPAHVAALLSRPEAVYDPEPLSRKLHTLFDLVFGRDRTETLQRDLKTLGFDPGPVDGAFGRATADALRAFQRGQGLREDGVPLAEVADLAHLLAEAERGREPGPPPEERLSANVYRNILKPARLAEGLEFYIQHRTLLRRMEARYQVPGPVAAGIVTVETRAGRYLGARPALATLASMAMGRDPELVRALFEDETLCPEQEAWLCETAGIRADWALREAAALLAYAEQAGADPLALPGSLYGAVGVSQFMPTSALEWGVDGDGDGRVDLFTVDDAVMSLANYLVEHGWETGGEDGARQALFRYNHSHRYVNTVLAVAGHVARAEPAEPAAEGLETLRVEDAAALLAALAPGRRIVLAPGVYDLAGAARDASNSHVRLVDDGSPGAPRVEIADLEGLVLTSEEGAELRGGLRLVRVNDALLDNLVLGQDNDTLAANPAVPMAAVLGLDQCGQIRVRDVTVRGNGGPGLEAVDSRDLSLVNVAFAGCGGPALRLAATRRVLVANGLFRGNTGERMLDLEDAAGVQLIACVMRDNLCPGGHLLHLTQECEVALLETYVDGNAALGLANTERGLARQGLELACNAFGP